MLQASRKWRIRNQPATKHPMFNRTHELEQLDSVCKKRPSDVLVVLGPRSCGKTATIKSYFADKKNAVYIDCRSIDASTPSSFVYALIKQLLPKIPRDTQKVVLETLASLPEWALRFAIGLTFA